MRILQLITLCELGGAQAVVVNLANSLCGQHEVIVAAGEGDGKMWCLLDEKVQCVHLPSLRRALSPMHELKAIAEMHQLYQRYKPDIIHLHSSKTGLLGRLAFPKSKIVYTVHGFDSIRVMYRKYLPLEKYMQKRCQAIVAVSRYDERNLKNEGITHHLGMIYNGTYTPQKLEDLESMTKEQLIQELVKARIAEARLKKGYEVKGDGSVVLYGSKNTR